MKFETNTPERQDDVVAYLDADGSLFVKNTCKGFKAGCAAIRIETDGDVHREERFSVPSRAISKFYAGDSLTITF